jgi:hypothetical protein
MRTLSLSAAAAALLLLSAPVHAQDDGTDTIPRTSLQKGTWSLSFQAPVFGGGGTGEFGVWEMVGARTNLGLVLSVYVRQLENFAGTMNFVIFPMFFLSTALYPLWKLQESGAWIVHGLARFNPFTHAVEAMRFALHGQVLAASLGVVAACTVAFFALALWGYDPQRGAARRPQGGPP